MPALGLLLIAAYVLSRWHPNDPLPGFPRVVLWAWDRPEDLRFLGAKSAGIAYLDRTIFLDPEKFASRPRLAPLRYTPGIPVMAVVRLEASARGLPSSRDGVVREILAAASRPGVPGVRALQIDFDSKKSEREWYRSLLRDVRSALPESVPLVITALESWCDGDPWIRDLPVADATPMLFQMGAGERVPSDFSLALCRSSIGVSLPDSPSGIPHGRRLFFFQKRAWSRDAYELAAAQAGRWQ